MGIARAFVAIGILGVVAGSTAWPSAEEPDDDAWTVDFRVDDDEWTSTGRNPYFILEPGHQLVFEDGEDTLTITVLDQTKDVQGVETRVVEERETEDGLLHEISRNFFALNRRTNGVFYFGEEVEIYEDGKTVRHEGEWLAGEKDARFGLFMPGQPLLRSRYYEEHAPGVAMDRAEIVSLDETVETPAGEFRNCLKVEETTPLEPEAKEYKYYAAGVGLVKDGPMALKNHGKAGGSSG